ncbi:LOW QUALITY PROTEIN: complement C1r-A subcomponent-like [Leucoraja erinacea]|uniref:LOW QUALITY PROTEIN: complement C1r-A subcomponent-like n=1 Tax=Leucoraja erinaceus TaxID=7782 RepID=UPI0024556E43|nr:LOW QUALITY PROTEIN: complement C1r-A subcomponent-like [Leucoraja erinacea]
MYGEISSPGFPSYYPNETRAEWYIAVPSGYYIRLHFRYFQMEASQGCVYDRLKVNEGTRTLGVFCGDMEKPAGAGNRPQPILDSTRNSLHLEFSSDFSNQQPYTGFHIYYEAVDVDECSQDPASQPVCDQICHNTIGSYTCDCWRGYSLRDDGRSCKVECQEYFSEMSGQFTSPGYPAAYPANLHCNYSIRVEEGFSISLGFQGLFEIESHPQVKCPYDNMTIEYKNTVLGPLCGSERPAAVDTLSNAVDILFHTDTSGIERGWKIHYTTDRIPCPALQTLEHGTISPILPQYRFLDRVRYSCDVGYKIMKRGRELTSFNMICMKDGTWNKDVIAICQSKVQVCRGGGGAQSDCGAPKVLANGKFQVLGVKAVKDGYLTQIQYSCDQRYRMKTEGDGMYTCSADRVWNNPTVSNTIPYCAPVCGVPDRPVTSLSVGRVLGGSEAPDGSFPWQVFVRPPQGRGAGVLVSDRWVLTAAHVLWNKDKNKPTDQDLESHGIYVGDNDLDDLVLSPGLPVERVYLHPNYSGSDPNYSNDIALIKLTAPLRLTADIAPVCLPPAGGPGHEWVYQEGRLGYLAGWGMTEDRRLTNKLHYASLPVANTEKCRGALAAAQPRVQKPLELTAGSFCAGTGLGGGADACQGDSGGVSPWRGVGGGGEQVEEGVWYVAGLVSWGLDCGKVGRYGVYTDVGAYIPWMQEVMEGHVGT